MPDRHEQIGYIPLLQSVQILRKAIDRGKFASQLPVPTIGEQFHVREKNRDIPEHTEDPWQIGIEQR